MSCLFRLGDFTLHSGDRSPFKIDCDRFDAEDWKTLAFLIAERVGAFSEVEGVPTGGLQLAEALKVYRAPRPGHPLLLVDDVLTTGNSMLRAADALDVRWRHNYIGAVAFARVVPPRWVIPLFSLFPRLR